MSSFGVHKSWILISLILASMIMLFLTCTLAMVYLQIHRDFHQVKLPYLFYFNTILLILSSLIFHKVKNNNFNLNNLISKCKKVLFLSILFLFLQSIAWIQLISDTVRLNSDRMSSFLFLLSGLHFAHVLGGIPFLLNYINKINALIKNKSTQNQVDYTLRFKLIRTYWYFLDFLWIYLIIFLYSMSNLL